MPKITERQLGILIAKANWGPGGSVAAAREFMDIAIAVASAESGLNTKAISSTNDYGIFQINKAAHPQYFTDGDTDRVFNPYLNVLMAKAIWEDAGRKWTPWSVYNNGSYRRYLGRGTRVYNYVHNLTDAQFSDAFRAIPDVSLNWQNGAKQFKNPDLGDFVGGTINEIPNAIGAFGDKIVTGAKAAGFFILAIVLLILGILFLLKDTSVGRGAVSLINPAKKMKAVLK